MVSSCLWWVVYCTFELQEDSYLLLCETSAFGSEMNHILAEMAAETLDSDFVITDLTSLLLVSVRHREQGFDVCRETFCEHT